MKRSLPLTIAIVAIVSLLVSTQSMYAVDETNHTVVQQFGQITSVRSDPGLKFKLPLIQQVSFLDKRAITLDTPPQEYLTSDEKRIQVDQVTRWRISDPQTFFLTARTETGGASRLRPLVEAELRAQIAGSLYDTMISEERDQMMDRVTTAVQMRVDDARLGIMVLDVRAKRADLPPAVEQSVFDRMQSARRVEADRHRAKGQREADEIVSETDRLVAIMMACAERVSEETRGLGEAKAIAIFADGLEQDLGFYSFLRRLEAYSKVFTPEDRIIVSSDSNFFQLLSGYSEPVDGFTLTSGPVTYPESGQLEPLSQNEVEKLIQECIPEAVQESGVNN